MAELGAIQFKSIGGPQFTLVAVMHPEIWVKRLLAEGKIESEWISAYNATFSKWKCTSIGLSPTEIAAAEAAAAEAEEAKAKAAKQEGPKPPLRPPPRFVRRKPMTVAERA